MSFKMYCCPESKFENIFTWDCFLLSYGALNIVILAILGQLTGDILRAINA